MRADSSSEMSTPVEVAREPARLDQLRGFAMGAALVAAFAHVLMLWDVDSLRDSYRAFAFEPPISAQVTMSRFWIGGVPVACVIALSVLSVMRPRSLVPYIVVAVACIAALLASWYFPMAPLRDLADSIK